MNFFDDKKNYYSLGETMICARVEMDAVGKPQEYIDVRMKELARSLSRITGGKIAEKLSKLFDAKFFEDKNLLHCEIQAMIPNKAIDDFVKLIDFKIVQRECNRCLDL